MQLCAKNYESQGIKGGGYVSHAGETKGGEGSAKWRKGLEMKLSFGNTEEEMSVSNTSRF